MSRRTRAEEYLAFYRTLPHECGYLPQRQAVNIVVDPALPLDTRLYSRLAGLGFRRSGARVYRPACPSCSACTAIRIPVQAFRANRSQRRIWRRNEDLTVVVQEPTFNEEHFDLYCRYLRARHPGGGMDDPRPEDYLPFFRCDGIETRFYDFREGGRCVAIAVIDVLADGLSAVYTFFDPDRAARSLGVHAVLWGIEATLQLGKPWFYLGYWIKDCRKMNYKTHYRPYELFIQGRWHGAKRGQG